MALPHRVKRDPGAASELPEDATEAEGLSLQTRGSSMYTRSSADAESLAREDVMKVIADLCIVPMGVGLSLSPYVAACEKVLKDAGLETRLHSYGTNVEGEWDAVFDALKRCHEVLHEMGAVRVSTNLRCGTRNDREQSMADKVRSVQEKM